MCIVIHCAPCLPHHFYRVPRLRKRADYEVLLLKSPVERVRHEVLVAVEGLVLELLQLRVKGFLASLELEFEFLNTVRIMGGEDVEGRLAYDGGLFPV